MRKAWLQGCLLFFSIFVFNEDVAAATGEKKILIVVGAEGAEEYAKLFDEMVSDWKKACVSAGITPTIIGVSADSPNSDLRVHSGSDLERLKQYLIDQKDSSELWVVLIGHGTFDGRETKFNLRGKDFTDHDMAEWLSDYTGELAVINTASASGAFLPTLSGKSRVLITATKSPQEYFYTRFGGYFAKAIGGLPEADLNKDEQVSLLEAFIHSSGKVEEFYQNEMRLATEHALLDDNGDQLGTRADWYEGTTAVKSAKEGSEPDGESARQKILVKSEFEKRFSPEQMRRRNELESAVRSLRRKKKDLAEDLYYSDLEKLLRELGAIYRDVENQEHEVQPGNR